MDRPPPPPRRRPPPSGRGTARPSGKPPTPTARYLALGSLLAAIVVFLVIVLGAGGGSGSHPSTTSQAGTHTTKRSPATGAAKPGTQTIPILAYNVINSQPAGSTAPASLYVPPDQFSAQMQALKAAGWRAVTLDQVVAYWTHGTSLGTSKPLVITFDGGYASQYANALPVLRELGWPAVVDIPSTLLPASEGGIADSQVHALISAGWQVGVLGSTQPDLTGLSASGLQSELTSEREAVTGRYGVTPNWFAYAGGHYNPTVTAGVHTAGFTGGLTSASGWASAQADRYRLPRLEVVGGTSAQQLLSQIASAQSQTSVPASG